MVRQSCDSTDMLSLQVIRLEYKRNCLLRYVDQSIRYQYAAVAEREETHALKVSICLCRVSG